MPNSRTQAIKHNSFTFNISYPEQTTKNEIYKYVYILWDNHNSLDLVFKLRQIIKSNKIVCFKINTEIKSKK